MADLTPEMIEKAKADRMIDYRLAYNKIIIEFGCGSDKLLAEHVEELLDERRKMIELLTDEQRYKLGLTRPLMMGWCCNG